MPAICGWSSGITPQPIRVGITGMPVSSANSRKRSAASALKMPPPATKQRALGFVEHGRTFSAWTRVAFGLLTGRGS